MTWEQMPPDGESLTVHERANLRADAYRRARSWTGLIHRQRERRIACESEKLKAQIKEYWEVRDGYHVDRLLGELSAWLQRDPYDESHWIVPRDQIA